jgi:uncharacterized protein
MPTKTSGVVRLADFPLSGNPVDFNRQCQMVAELEEEYRKAIAPAVQLSAQGMASSDFFSWAAELTRVRPQIQGLEHWEQIEQQIIAPHVNQRRAESATNETSGKRAIRESWRILEIRCACFAPVPLVSRRYKPRDSVAKPRPVASIPLFAGAISVAIA